MSSLSFEHIEYFIEVCQRKSITDAASHLFISQQALSRRIQKLENQLGYTLFQRTPKGVLMTEAAARLYETFLPCVLSYKKAELQILSQSGNQIIILTFAVAPGIINSLTPELILDFGKLYPGLELNIIDMTDKQVVQYIHEDKSRFGLVASPEWIHEERHSYTYLFTEPTWLLVHKSNPLSSLASVSLEMLRDERVLALAKNTYYQDALNKAVAPFHFSITPYFESNDILDLVSMVKRGIGVLLCTKHLYEEVAFSNTVLIPVSERTFDCPLSFIYQEFSALDSLAQAFILFVQNAINKTSEKSKEGEGL